MCSNKELIEQLRGGLIVSCQASPSPFLADPAILAAIAEAVVAGGAGGIRADGPENIRAIRKLVKVPVIGIWKRHLPDSEIHITPRLEDVLAVAETEAEVVALDATSRPRPDGETLKTIVDEAKARGAPLLMADVSNFEEGLKAVEMGFDLVATTLSGYVESTTENSYGPDLDLVKRLASYLDGEIPVIAEGRISTPEQAAKALELGAHAVVVGTAITRPQVLTEQFCAAIRRAR